MDVKQLQPFEKIPKSFKGSARQAAVQHNMAKIMLHVFDMQEQAGITDEELVAELLTQSNRMAVKLLYAKGRHK
jgi:hypothetical protein